MKRYAFVTVMILASPCVATAQITLRRRLTFSALTSTTVAAARRATHPIAAHRATATPDRPILRPALPLYGARMPAVCMARPITTGGGKFVEVLPTSMSANDA